MLSISLQWKVIGFLVIVILIIFHLAILRLLEKRKITLRKNRDELLRVMKEKTKGELYNLAAQIRFMGEKELSGQLFLPPHGYYDPCLLGEVFASLIYCTTKGALDVQSYNVRTLIQYPEQEQTLFLNSAAVKYPIVEQMLREKLRQLKNEEREKRDRDEKENSFQKAINPGIKAARKVPFPKKIVL